MRIRNILLSVMLAGGAVAASGCTTRAYLVSEAPPPARAEVPVARPGYVWVHGHYAREGGRWKWVDGRHVREREGHVYVGGRWDKRPQGYVWIEGGWRSDGQLVRRP